MSIFRSEYDEVDLLRPTFGHWDALDPVAQALLDVVEAQGELSDVLADDGQHNLASPAAFKAVIDSATPPAGS
jgi:hypothetical protein